MYVLRKPMLTVNLQLMLLQCPALTFGNALLGEVVIE